MNQIEADRLQELLKELSTDQLLALWRWLFLEWVTKYEQERA